MGWEAETLRAMCTCPRRHYLMPKNGILSLHSGCNVGAQDDVTLFFGLSGG